jgi:cell division protein FtsN
MQLHPGDEEADYPPEKIKAILKKHCVIGFDIWREVAGEKADKPFNEWTDEDIERAIENNKKRGGKEGTFGIIRKFQKEMKVGDIVAVRRGTTPIALVRVSSDYFMSEEREEEGKVEESKESQKQEESGKQDDSSILAPLFQKTQPKPEVQPKPVQPKPQVVEREEEEDRFYLQVGVFRNKINASRLAEKLREKGYEAKTVTHHGKYIKVIVGYFSSKEDALKVKEELKKDGYNSILRRR